MVSEFKSLNSGMHYSYHPFYSNWGDDKKIKERMKDADKRGWVAFEEYYTYESGGNCWNDDPPSSCAGTEKNSIDEFDEFITSILEKIKPDINFLEYKKLLNNIKPILKSAEMRINEYYGNHTTYYGTWLYIDELYDVLVDKGLIESLKNDKHAILIGGLPCSGKTTLAKTTCEDYHLIDDPFDLKKDVEPHLKRKKLVITSPHLSFRKVREDAITMLEGKGYVVDVVLCDEPKQTLRARAKKLGKLDQVSEFIKNYRLEK